MVSRIWRGWTAFEDATAYERLLRDEMFPAIAERAMKGYLGIHLLRRDLQDSAEFVTVMWFDSLESIKAFSGADYEGAVVPEKARALLFRFDECSSHYHVLSAPE